MNSKRRAELQRKLSMGAVPRPPADLSERIKADIPQYLQAEVDRGRFTGSVAFTMRVAASILMLITTAFITLRLLEPETRQNASMAPRPKLVPAVTRYEQPAPNAPPAVQAAGEEVRLDISQEMPMASVSAPPPPSPAIPAPQQQGAAERRRDEADDATAFAAELPSPSPAEESTVFADASNEMTESTEKKTRDAISAGRTMTARAEAPMVAPPPPAAPSLISEAQASDFDLGPPYEVFGISVDPNAFTAMKTTLEAGKRPAAGTVDIDALVNYFAGRPTRATRRPVVLEVEASPAPLEAEGDQAILRFSIDTPRMDLAPRASTPPVARDVSVEIHIDPKAVANFRRIGGSTSIDSESMLQYNVSVTGLYQLELRPELQARQHVATVRLHYRSITDGRKHMLTKTIQGADLARDWSRASRRHRLASLGAVWSESLKTTAPQPDVVKRAEELATQEPADARARELANAANATSGGKR
jgi:hypothetical protein